MNELILLLKKIKPFLDQRFSFEFYQKNTGYKSKKIDDYIIEYCLDLNLPLMFDDDVFLKNIKKIEKSIKGYSIKVYCVEQTYSIKKIKIRLESVELHRMVKKVEKTIHKEKIKKNNFFSKENKKIFADDILEENKSFFDITEYSYKQFYDEYISNNQDQDKLNKALDFMTRKDMIDFLNYMDGRNSFSDENYFHSFSCILTKEIAKFAITSKFLQTTKK